MPKNYNRVNRRRQFKLNWKPSPFDSRDYKFSERFTLPPTLPDKADVNSLIPEVWDQQSYGSCVFHGTGMNVLYVSREQNREIDPSRLFLYYVTRELEGTLNEDSGAYVRDAFKMLSKVGVCKESTWPYSKDMFMKPSDIAYKEATQTLGVQYHKLNNTSLSELQSCIALGKPFVMGFTVYNSFMYGNWKDTMPLPKKGEQILGGHCVIAVSYDNSRQAFRMKNSWSKNWKDGGYFWMPYSFITNPNECDDFWVLEKVSDLQVPEPTPTPTPTPVPTDTFKSGLKKILTKPNLIKMSEPLIVKIGKELGVETNLVLTKNQNIDLVWNNLAS